MTTTYRDGIGRLVTDRYTFQSHIDGTSTQHKAGVITLDPAIVINSVTHTTVQGAITEIAPFAVAVPDATASVKGKIKLSGDLGYGSGTADSPKCSATYLLGRSLGAAPPSDEDVLTWDSGASTWVPTAIPVQFSPGGDLGGDSLDQEVLSATGSGGSFDISCNDLTFASTVTPRIRQSQLLVGSGANLSISAQSCTLGSGGDLLLYSGNGSSFRGAVKLQLHDTPLLELAEVVSGNYILSLVKGSAITSTEMPSGTGNKVIYIANAPAYPTVSPVGGAVLFSYGGKLFVKQSGGDLLSVNDANNLLDSYTIGQNTLDNPGKGYQFNITTPTSVQTDILVITMPFDSSALIEWSMAAVSATDGYSYQSKQILAARRGSGNAIQDGITTVHSSTYGTWSSAPLFTFSGTDITIKTSSHLSLSSSWNIHIKVNTAFIA